MHWVDSVTDIDRQTEPSYRVKILPEKTFASHHVNVTDAFPPTIVYRGLIALASSDQDRTIDSNTSGVKENRERMCLARGCGVHQVRQDSSDGNEKSREVCIARVSYPRDSYKGSCYA